MTFPPDPSFTSTALNPDRLLAGDAKPVTEKVVLTDIDTSGPLVRGTVLGQITTGGKWGICLNAEATGSEVARGILLEDADPTGADVDAMIYRAGQFNQDALTFGLGTTIANARESLANQGIYLRPPVSV